MLLADYLPLFDIQSSAIYIAARNSDADAKGDGRRIVPQCLIVNENQSENIYPDAAMADYVLKSYKVNLVTKIGNYSVHTESDNAKFNFSVVSEPNHGKILTDDNGRVVAYEPENGYEGRDGFTVRVKNGKYVVDVKYFASIQENAHDLKYKIENFCSDVPKKAPWIWNDFSISPLDQLPKTKGLVLQYSNSFYKFWPR